MIKEQGTQKIKVMAAIRFTGQESSLGGPLGDTMFVCCAFGFRCLCVLVLERSFFVVTGKCFCYDREKHISEKALRTC